MGFLDRARAAVTAFQTGPETISIKPLSHPIEAYFPIHENETWGLSAIDDLVEKHGIGVYREMVERDDMVRASVMLLTLGRLSSGWEVTARSDDPQDIEIRDFCEHVLTDLDETNVTRLLQDTLDALPMGFSCIEKVWREPYPAGHEWAGKQGYRTFRALPQETVTFKRDEMGEIEPDGVWQAKPREIASSRAPTDFNRMPRDRFIIWTWMRKWGSPLGLSILRPAYRWYFIKTQLVPWMARYMEHFGQPIVAAEVPKGANKNEKDAVLEALRTFQSQQRIVYPTGTKIHVFEQSRTHQQNFEAAVAVCNRGIARSCVQPETLIDAPDRGTYALGSSQKGVFEWFLDHLGTTQEDEIMDEQVLRPLVRRNFGEQARPPIWRYSPFSEPDLERLAGAYEKLSTGAKVPIPLSHIYESTGIPEPRDGEPTTTSGNEGPEQGLPPTFGDEGDELDGLLAAIHGNGNRGGR